MKSGSKSLGLSRRYIAALRKHLTQGPRASFEPAERLGRQALAVGLETSDLARIHEQALITLVPPTNPSRTSNQSVRRAATFFVKALAPIETNHRAVVENNGRSKRLNLRRHTAELAAANRRLTREIGRRKAVEKALKKSEQHYSRLLEKSRQMQEHLRFLSHEILSTQEKERKEISRELHDEIGQTLTAINVKLATLAKEATANTRGLKKKIVSTQRLVEKSLNTVHRFARELRPALLDDLGLIPALHSYMKGWTKRTHIRIHFTVFAAVEQLDGDKRMVLYRVAQEALTNVAKHAQASLVKVRIQKLPGAVCMQIHDNGKSFEAKRVMSAKKIKRLGLLGMRERVEMVGGSFTVESAPGKGTTICAEIPFGNGHEPSPDARAGGPTE